MPRTRTPAHLLALATVVVALTAAGCSLGGDRAELPATRAGPIQAEGLFARIPGIVQDVQPSVVAVRTDRGEGSGVVWSADGVIVTNHHVVADRRRLRVGFADGRRSPARIQVRTPSSPTWRCCAPTAWGCPRSAVSNAHRRMPTKPASGP